MKPRPTTRSHYETLCDAVGKRVELVTAEGRWYGWLRKQPEVSMEIAAADGSRIAVGAFTLWGVRDDIPNDEVPYRVFSLAEVVALRVLPASHHIGSE